MVFDKVDGRLPGTRKQRQLLNQLEQVLAELKREDVHVWIDLEWRISGMQFPTTTATESTTGSGLQVVKQ